MGDRGRDDDLLFVPAPYAVNIFNAPFGVPGPF